MLIFSLELSKSQYYGLQNLQLGEGNSKDEGEGRGLDYVPVRIITTFIDIVFLIYYCKVVSRGKIRTSGREALSRQQVNVKSLFLSYVS